VTLVRCTRERGKCLRTMHVYAPKGAWTREMERSQLKCKFCWFLCRWVGGVRVYYSHPKWTYYTKDEERAIKTIKRCLGDEVEIVNPRDYDENPDFALQKKYEGLSVRFKLIDQTDCVVFQRFRIPNRFRKYVLDYLKQYQSRKDLLKNEMRNLLDEFQQIIARKRHMVTPSVAEEVNYALETGKPVYELVGSKLKARVKKLKSDFNGPYDPLYKTFSLFLKAYRKMDTILLLYPSPFWWLKE